MDYTPRFPFGFGLSYTQFNFSNLKLDKNEIRPAGKIRISVDVKNVGAREGDEVVQLYIRDLAGSVTRPVKQLEGFERITLKAGETKTVNFTLGPEHLGFYDQNMKWIVEPGDFNIWVGPNSVEGLEGQFKVIR